MMRQRAQELTWPRRAAIWHDHRRQFASPGADQLRFNGRPIGSPPQQSMRLGRPDNKNSAKTSGRRRRKREEKMQSRKVTTRLIAAAALAAPCTAAAIARRRDSFAQAADLTPQEKSAGRGRQEGRRGHDSQCDLQRPHRRAPGSRPSSSVTTWDRISSSTTCARAPARPWRRCARRSSPRSSRSISCW